MPFYQLKSDGVINGNLNLSILMMIQGAFVDNVGQDKTTENMQYDLLSRLSTFSFSIITKSVLHLTMEAYF